MNPEIGYRYRMVKEIQRLFHHIENESNIAELFLSDVVHDSQENKITTLFNETEKDHESTRSYSELEIAEIIDNHVNEIEYFISTIKEYRKELPQREII